MCWGQWWSMRNAVVLRALVRKGANTTEYRVFWSIFQGQIFLIPLNTFFLNAKVGENWRNLNNVDPLAEVIKYGDLIPVAATCLSRALTC